jgi:ectoine hydroxylase-related dioxygenase (phytanoyl-CoA dioxygenase family)
MQQINENQLATIKQEYHQNGFVIIKDLIPDTCLDYFADSLRQFISYHLSKRGITLNDPLNEGMMELNKTKSGRSAIYDINRTTDAVGKIIYDENIVAVIKRLLGLGNDQFLHVLHQVCRIDGPTDERFTYGWHQQSYYSIFEAAEVQLWAPMIETSRKEMGTMSILLRSHKREVPHYMSKKADQIFMTIPDEQVKHFEEKFIVINPGDVIFFHPLLIHRSNRNVSNRVRYTLIADYVNPFDPRFKVSNRSNYQKYHHERTANYKQFSKRERINYLKNKILSIVKHKV